MKLSIIAQLDVIVDYITSGGKKIAEKNPKATNKDRCNLKSCLFKKQMKKKKKKKKKK